VTELLDDSPISSTTFTYSDDNNIPPQDDSESQANRTRRQSNGTSAGRIRHSSPDGRYLVVGGDDCVRAPFDSYLTFSAAEEDELGSVSREQP
jgi:hypothetical protein